MDCAQVLEQRILQRYSNLITRTCTKYEDSQIQQFYDGATVFITGGTGFLGKHLIEKILRATNVSKIFLLLRSKKEKTIEDRLCEMLKDPVYELLKEMQPQFQQKLVAVAGDVAELRLGMSDDDWNIVIQQTDIIFHVAATTRFDETLRVATLTNVRGTRETLILGTHCNKLSLIKGWPNTYSFTKAVSEELVRTKGRNLPICVVRPAIVVCAHREPRPGWFDLSCVYGAAGLVLAGGLGVSHVAHNDPDVTLAFIPVDYVNNAIISAGWETANKSDEEIKIYTVTTSTRNGMPFRKMQQLFIDAGHKYPLASSLWCYFMFIIPNPALYFICSLVLHIIPAYIADGICLLIGKQRIATKMAMKLYRMSKALSYFTLNNWNFEDKNLAALYEKQTPRDKQIFDFDVTTLDWREYLLIFGMGIRKYIIKDGLTGTEYGRKKQIVFRILMLFLFPLYLYMLYKVIYLGVFTLAYIFNMIWCYSTKQEIVTQNENVLFVNA